VLGRLALHQGRMQPELAVRQPRHTGRNGAVFHATAVKNEVIMGCKLYNRQLTGLGGG
jgi:hypothetical protein